MSARDTVEIGLNRFARRGYDPEDKSGHWAWNWERGVK